MFMHIELLGPLAYLLTKTFELLGIPMF